MMHNRNTFHHHETMNDRDIQRYPINRPTKGLRSYLPVRITIDETEHAVLISNGRIERTLPTGVATVRPRRDRVVRIPAVEQLVFIVGQEMLTQDGAGIRATAAVSATVTDPIGVVRRGGWRDALYLEAQLALRGLVANLSLEDLLANRGRLDIDLDLALAPRVEQLGVELGNVAIRDLTVPGELRRAVADVVVARLSGQAALERARGETAALRSLANGANAISDNPALLQLRLIQQIENSSGNTFVLGSNQLLG